MQFPDRTGLAQVGLQVLVLLGNQTPSPAADSENEGVGSWLGLCGKV